MGNFDPVIPGSSAFARVIKTITAAYEVDRMQVQQPISQQQALAGEMERYQVLCAWVEVAGQAMVDSESDGEDLDLPMQPAEASIWGQVMVWQAK